MSDETEDKGSVAKVVVGYLKEQLSGDDAGALLERLLAAVGGGLESTDTGEADRLVADLVLAVESKLGDATGALEVAKAIAGVLFELMELVESTKKFTGEEKRKLVVGLVWGIYHFIDRGVDGSKNRIDLPWIPEAIEEKIEKKVVTLAAGFAVESVVAMWNRNRG